MNEGSAAALSAGGRRVFARRIGVAVGAEFARLEIAAATLAELAAFLTIAVGPILARPAVLLLRAHRPVLTLLVAAALVAALLRLTLAFGERRLRAGARRVRLALHVGLRRERSGVAFDGRSEPVGDAAEILVVLDLDRLPFARRPAALGVRLGGLGGGDEAEIVLGVLQVVLGRDRIAAGVGVARELQILLGDVVGVAADLHVGPVRFIRTGQRIGPPPIVGGAIAAHPLVVLTRSHRMFLD